MGFAAMGQMIQAQGEVVLMAWGLATGSFVGLTIFTAYNPFRIQFNSWGTMLFGGTWVLVLWSFAMYMFGTYGLAYKIYTLVGCVIFMGWICYDTNKIFTRFGPGDELMCAMKLYLDVINLVTY